MLLTDPESLRQQDLALKNEPSLEMAEDELKHSMILDEGKPYKFTEGEATAEGSINAAINTYDIDTLARMNFKEHSGNVHAQSHQAIPKF